MLDTERFSWLKGASALGFRILTGFVWYSFDRSNQLGKESGYEHNGKAAHRRKLS